MSDLAAIQAKRRIDSDLTALIAARQELRFEVTNFKGNMSMRDLISAQPADRPILLMPVRIETKFERSNAGTATALLIRIFTDTIHTEFFNERLTEQEYIIGRKFWDAEATVPDSDSANIALEAILADVEPERVMHVLEVTSAQATPPVDMILPEDEAGLSNLAQIHGLPDRFVAIGWRNGVRLFEKEGNLVDPALPTLLDPETPDSVPTWFHDFDEAVALGMGIRVPITDFHPLSTPDTMPIIDRLIVTGVEAVEATEADPQSARNPISSLGKLMRGHRYGPTGLSFPGHGAPTNATEIVDAPGGTETLTPENIRALLAQSAGDASDDPSMMRDSDYLADALGLQRELFYWLPGAERSERQIAAHIFDALAPGSLGAYLDLLSEGNRLGSNGYDKAIQSFAKRYVRPEGPFAPIRIDDQPYGFLPVMEARDPASNANNAISSDDTFEQARQIIENLLNIFSQDIANVVDAAQNEQDALADRALLTHHIRKLPYSRTYDRRIGFHEWHVWNSFLLRGRTKEANTRFSGRNESGIRPLFQRLEGKTFPIQANLFFAQYATGIATPLLPQEDIPDRLQNIADVSMAGLQEAMTDKTISIFERLSILSIYWGLISARSPLLDGVNTYPIQIENIANSHFFNEHSSLAFFNQVGNALRPHGGNRAVNNALATFLSNGTTSVGDLILSLPAEVLDNFQIPLNSIRNALTNLQTVPSEVLSRHTSLFLDGLSYRIDAWRTALATYQLDFVRKKFPDRIPYVGAYGIIENLSPGPPLQNTQNGHKRMPGNLGFIHAHTIDHATTGAVMRNGYESFQADGHGEALAIELTSERVQHARNLTEALAQGGSLESIFGSHFERILRQEDRNGDILQFLPLLRSTFPAYADRLGETATDEPEQAEGMQIVNGYKIINQLEDQGATGLDFSASLSGVSQRARPKIDKAARFIVDIFDAFQDLSITEAVHQLIRGEPERSAAAIDMLNGVGAGAFPTPEVARATPDANAVTMRVMQIHNVTPVTNTNPTVRQILAPGIDQWLHELLQELLLVKFPIHFHHDGEQKTGFVSLHELGMPAIDLVMATSEAIKHELAIVASGNELNIKFLESEEGTELELAFSILSSCKGLIYGAQPLETDDLSAPGVETANTDDAIEIESRINKVVTILNSFRDSLQNAPSTDVPQTARWALLFDPELYNVTGQSGEDIRDVLVANINQRIDNINTHLSGSITRDQLIEIAKLACGKDTITTIPFMVADATILNLSPAASTGLLAHASSINPEPLSEWADGLSRIRTRFEHLSNFRLHKDILKKWKIGDITLSANQIPYKIGDHWHGMDLPETYEFEDNMAAIAILSEPNIDLSRAVEGLRLDDWTESITQKETVQGLSLHFDAPNTQPPNTCLLAVPRMESDNWNLDSIISCIEEALSLTEERAITQDHFAANRLSDLLPATLAPLVANMSDLSVDFAAATPATDDSSNENSGGDA